MFGLLKVRIPTFRPVDPDLFQGRPEAREQRGVLVSPRGGDKALLATIREHIIKAVPWGASSCDGDVLVALGPDFFLRRKTSST